MRSHFLAVTTVILAAVGQRAASSEPAPAAADTCASPPAVCCPLPEVCEPTRFWLRTEDLLWWIKRGPVALPLLTAGTPASQGVVGAPGTVVFFGGSDFDYGTFNGLRVTTGAQLADGMFGFETGGFVLEHRSVGFSATADPIAGPLLARPIIDANTGLPSSTGVHFMGRVPVTGFDGSSSSRLWGAEANVTATLPDTLSGTLRLLTGFRYLDLDEFIDDDTIIFAVRQFGSFVPGTLVSSLEHFHGRSQFYGGQVGAEGEWSFGPIVVDLRAKVALGDSHETVVAQGSQLQTFPNGTTVRTADSVLARSTNINSTRRDAFAVIPEVGANVGYEITHNLRLFAGYSFLYWSNVSRPGDQIDPIVNLNRTGGPARPLPQFNRSDFWAHGVNLGLEMRY